MQIHLSSSELDFFYSYEVTNLSNHSCSYRVFLNLYSLMHSTDSKTLKSSLLSFGFTVLADYLSDSIFTHFAFSYN